MESQSTATEAKDVEKPETESAPVQRLVRRFWVIIWPPSDCVGLRIQLAAGYTALVSLPIWVLLAVFWLGDSAIKPMAWSYAGIFALGFFASWFVCRPHLYADGKPNDRSEKCYRGISRYCRYAKYARDGQCSQKDVHLHGIERESGAKFNGTAEMCDNHDGTKGSNDNCDPEIVGHADSLSANNQA